MPNIAIVWDFDGTLTPHDSTTKVVEFLQGKMSGGDFWNDVKSLRGDRNLPKWEHVLASDAPIWMYALSRLAFKKRVPLNSEFFERFIVPSIELYDHVPAFFRKIKLLEETAAFKAVRLGIDHFVVSAGLLDLVKVALPSDIIRGAFGCRYKVVASEGKLDEPESVPVFCMDETMKTRSLFEIAKGSFLHPDRGVNRKVSDDDYWAPFENIIYVGDGPTDVPALSLVRSQGGVGIAVYDPNSSRAKINDRLKEMRLDRRADLITSADFSEGSELWRYISSFCEKVSLRYRAENSI